MKHILISKKELKEIMPEMPTPKLRGKAFKGVKLLGIVIRDTDKITDWEGDNGGTNPTREFDNQDSRIDTLFQDMRRKSDDSHNIRSDELPPVIVKFSNSDTEYKVSGYGRCKMFKVKGQSFYAFLLYEIEDSNVIEDMMIYFNNRPRMSEATYEEKVSRVVEKIGDKNTLPQMTLDDIPSYIEDVFVTTSPEVKGKMEEDIKNKVKGGKRPSKWSSLDRWGVEYDKWVDNYASSHLNYMKFDEERSGWVCKQIMSGNQYFQSKFWTVMSDYLTKGARTQFIGHTKKPSSHKKLTEMRLELYNHIEREWEKMCRYFNRPNKRRHFKLKGFFPQDLNNENQSKLVSVGQMFKDAKSYGLI